MTLGEMEKRVRMIVGDRFETYRFSPGFVLTALCEGVERLRDIRPESRYFNLALFDWARPAGLSVESTSDADAAAAQAFEPYFDAKWNDAVVSYAASRCYESDQGDTANAQLAAEQMSKFEKLAMS